MVIARFNRHENMDSETRRRILDLITDLSIIENCKPNRVINMLYGSFDGYDYSYLIEKDELLNELRDGGNDGLVNDILAITTIVKDYPKSGYEEI